jgi:hypothetical protein
MKKYLKSGIIVATLLLATSCSVTFPGIVTDNPSEKRSEISAKSILGFPPMKADLSIKKACQKGDITNVSTVDYKVKGGLFSKTYYVIVTGK